MAVAGRPRSIGIIGEGRGGMLMAIHLLRAARVPLRLVLVERAGLAAGQAGVYRGPLAAPLLDSPAIQASGFGADPEHFLRWARRATGSEWAADSYLPQALYDAYLRAMLAWARAESAPQVRIRLVHDEAVGLTVGGRGVRVHLHSGESLRIGAVVLAIGHLETTHPLLRDLMARGLVRLRGLDLDVHADGALVNCDGVPSSRLFCLGLPCAHREVLSTPALRTQVERLASRLLDPLDATQIPPPPYTPITRP
jgi:uncharacterized NAD(P)/FAD-binding protein YdhS